ncbi:hypothetical protein PIROE2DRAFT_17009 [Piromyces sp. E2]|nr:hypothetical protein PIROE2DRAFT_17009 [Piromyces sp. E2]|eukprot:OUM57870.1 hypothetical protein PIROE2DRAFT_17009 [Piromyces sp. E2]
MKCLEERLKNFLRLIPRTKSSPIDHIIYNRSMSEPINKPSVCSSFSSSFNDVSQTNFSLL